MMRQERDSRINTGAFSFRRTAGMFLAMMAFSGTHMAIYVKLGEWGVTAYGNPQLYINLLGGYVLLMAALMTAFSAWLHHHNFSRPMRRLSAAARQVAAGDFSVRIAPMRKDGKKDYVEVMFDDFNTMAEELGSIETLKNDFVSNVSHEIKTPLAIIMNTAALLQNQKLTDDEREEYTHTIISASKRLTSLVTNILKLNKLENQEIVSITEPYDLGEQLRECALAFVDLWEQKDLNFVADIDDDIRVCCDASMLEIAWNNLLSNAIKFTSPGGAIALKLKKEDGRAVVTVRDTGCGMDEKTGRRIFDKFYQGDTSRSQEGNGLGLTLVKRLIDLLGGDITVDSKLGEGSVFTVRLDTVDLC